MLQPCGCPILYFPKEVGYNQEEIFGQGATFWSLLIWDKFQMGNLMKEGTSLSEYGYFNKGCLKNNTSPRLDNYAIIFDVHLPCLI